MNLDWLKQLDMPYDVLGERGEIVIVNGDCLKVLAAMPKGCVDACVTDPPYLIGANSIGNARAKSGTWADLNNSAYWFSAWYRCAWDTMPIDRQHFATFCNWRTQPLVVCAMAQAEIQATSCLIWNKEWIGPAYKNALRPIYEVVLIASGTDTHILDRSATDIWACKWMAAHSEGNHHPAEKPVELMARLADTLTSRDGVILDPFLGSGTTLVACVRTGRRGIGIEIDTGYYQIAKRRILAELAQPRLPFAEPVKHEQTEMFAEET